MKNQNVTYGAVVGVFAHDLSCRLNIAPPGTKTLVPADVDSPTTRLLFRRLDGPSSGVVEEDHLIGIFTEDGNGRLDIAEDCFEQKTLASNDSDTTQFIIENLIEKKNGDICYEEPIGIFSVDKKFRLDIGQTALKKLQSPSHSSFATELYIRIIKPTNQDHSFSPGNESNESSQPTLERILVAVYEAVKRAQVDVQRGIEKKINWFFPPDEKGVSTPRMLKIPVKQIDGTETILDIPLFALAPHHDLKIEDVVVKMRVDLMQIQHSSKNPTINEIVSQLPHGGRTPDQYADIEIHLKGTDPVEGISRLSDLLTKTL
jgi:hypothetical protein